MSRTLPALFATACLVLASACAHPPATALQEPTNAWSGSEQMVLVTTPGWNATEGTMRRYERDPGGKWRQSGGSAPITVGRSGAAWGIGLHPAQAGTQKKEGDGRAPAGIFKVGDAFGYATSSDTALPYRPMLDSSWCMDVVDSPLYNRIVDARDVGETAVQGSSEPMRLDLHHQGDQRYREGFVIEHNPDAVQGAGSCIFAHLWGKPGQATAGCTAMAPGSMAQLYGWLKPDADPVFVLLPQGEYQRLRDDWQLPDLNL